MAKPTGQAGRTAGKHTGVNSVDPLLDEHAAATVLNLSVKTLRRWRWSRCGPPWFRIGGTAVRYRLSDLTAFIEAGRQATAGA
jgi:hypothetical protein